MGQVWRVAGTKVNGIRRGEVTLEEGPDGREMRLPLDSEDDERFFASLLGQEVNVTVTLLTPGATTDDMVRCLTDMVKDQGAEIARLKHLVKELEDSKGVLSCRVERSNVRYDTWVFTCPSGDEHKLGMYVASAIALDDYHAVARGVARMANAVHGDPKKAKEVLDLMAMDILGIEGTEPGDTEEEQP